MGFSRLLVLAFAVTATRAFAAVPGGFTETTFASGLSEITGIEWAPDGSPRLFVSRKGGELRIVENGAVRTTPFATETVYTNSECGLIGFAFDPDYVTNRYVYLFITVSASEQQIVRYTDVNSVGQGRTVILGNLPTRGFNHDGGAIGFGPDGKLYWAIGDLGNGTGVNADLGTLAAKIGRANPDGSVPVDNPFRDGAGPNKDHIWARGHRNPYTFTFHPVSGALWVNTVGTSWEQVFVVTRGSHAGWNQYENNQPAGFLTPVIAYRTNNAATWNLVAGTGAARAGGVATFTTTSAHGLRRGMRVVIAGVADASFNGAGYVASVPSGTRFTLAQAGADATSGGGTVTLPNLGGCVTGGIFYDATLFPAGYRGDFFFGDLNAGHVVHASVDAAGSTVESVDVWATSLAQAIDVAVGPDGALYLAQFGGSIRRVVPNAPPQGLVVSRRNLRLREGGGGTFSVSLAQAPAAQVVVTLVRSGDGDLTSAIATLTFTPANWATPQTVLFTAAQDADATDDTATVTLSAFGLGDVTVALSAGDDDATELVLSRTQLRIAEGGSGTFTVALEGTTGGSVTVTTTRTAGDADVTVSSGASLTFTLADHATPQTVTVAAAEDADDTPDTATLTLAASGMASRTLEVEVIDNEPSAPAFVSTPVVSAVVDAPYTYDAEALGTPTPTFSITGPAGMSVDATTGLVTWTPTATGSAPVTLTASNGVSPAATQGFTIDVASDAPPTARLTRPLPDATLAGKAEEFFGDCLDDVGCPRGEFYVDDVLVFTDTAAGNHFHAGGTHGQFDTTAFADGPHTLKLRVFDTRGATAEASVAVTFANGAEEPGPQDPGRCGCQSTGGGVGLLLAALAALGAAPRKRRPAAGP